MSIKDLWQLPQNLVGLLVKIFTRATKDGELYRWRYNSGLSLGRYVFVSKTASDYTIRHEKGHQKQSQKLGWLYLIIIGLPSLFWCILWTCFLKYHFNYYSFYTEKWANKEGGNS